MKKDDETKDERKKGQQEVQTLTNSYLMIDPNKSNGVLPRLYNYTDYNAFSRPTEDIDVSTGSITQSTTALPNPIAGKFIHLPDGSVSVPGLAWASDTTSGRYKIGTSNFGESVAGDLVFDWNASRLRLDSGFSLDITDMTLGSVLFAGSGGRVSQDNSNFFWDDTNNFLGIGVNTGLFRPLEVRHASTSQVVMSSSANAGVMFTGGTIGLAVEHYTNLSVAPIYDFIGDFNDITKLRVVNNNSGASAAGALQVQSQAGSGDAMLQMGVIGGSAFSFGLDNSVANDPLTLSNGAVLGTNNILQITTGGFFTHTQIAASSGTSHAFTITGPVNTGGSNGLFKVTNGLSTGQTLSTEINFVNFDLSTTTTWATGAITDERVFQIKAPTLAFAGASVVTRAATLYIDRAPQAGANATITNSYALWVDAGDVRIDGALSVGSFALSGFSQGSVLFAGASGAVTEDNANFYWDDTLNALGIGDVPFDGIRLRIGGTITPSAGTYGSALIVDATINAAAGENAYGSDFGCNIQEASSGTHGELGAAFYNASFVGGAGSTTVTSILRIGDRGTIGTRNYSFYATTSDSLTDPMAHLEQQGAGDCAIRLEMNTATPRSYILGIDATDDVFKIAYNSSNAILGTNDFFSVASDGETTVAQWLQIGTATDPAAQGDFVAGLTGAARMFYDQSVPTLTFTNSSGTTVNLISSVASTATVWNEQGADIDFRIEGDTAANLFFLDASTDFIGINTSGPDRRLDILDASNPQIRLTSTDGSVYVDLHGNSSGNFVITPTGGTFGVAATTEPIFALTSNAGSGRNWTFTSGGGIAITAGNLAIRDLTAGTAPFIMEGAAPNFSLYIDTSGNILVNASSVADSAKFYVAGKISTSGEMEINGALNHDGSTVGFFGAAPTTQPTYTISNVTTDRSYDADATTLAEVADALGTLIADLRAYGLVL